ncbi:MAG: twin-arginine translocation signal domain-containing protein [Anaerolineae bacterium]
MSSHITRRALLRYVAVLGAGALLAACTPQPTATPNTLSPTKAEPQNTEQAETKPTVSATATKAPSSDDTAAAPAASPTAKAATGIYAISLIDVATDRQFTLPEFSGTPVLLHPFALW